MTANFEIMGEFSKSRQSEASFKSAATQVGFKIIYDEPNMRERKFDI